VFIFTSFHILPCLSIVITHVACNTIAHNVKVYAKTRTGNAGVSLLWGVFQCWYIRYTCNRGLAECATGAAIRLLVDLSKKLVVPEQAVLLLADLDGAAAELGNQDLVTGLDADGNAVAGLVERARADGEDLGLVQLLDGGLGQEDAACGLGLGLEALDEHAVEERGEGADGLEGRHCD